MRQLKQKIRQQVASSSQQCVGRRMKMWSVLWKRWNVN